MRFNSQIRHTAGCRGRLSRVTSRRGRTKTENVIFTPLESFIKRVSLLTMRVSQIPKQLGCMNWNISENNNVPFHITSEFQRKLSFQISLANDIERKLY